MPDYGHPLRFATFIGPTNSPPSRPVELAQLSERLGFDFVTFQDHPYKSSYLDTWTLLSWVAARTERIGVSGNMLNLPLRQPPAILARAAASLDLLSDGRTSLGLGAGYYWDAVQAIGGRRLTPLQGVMALDEAIDIIRAVWDADEPGGVDVDGEFYSVHGSERGPAPAHEIPIWIGAREITRLLNIFAGQQTQETLAQMAVEDGVSIFVLASDDPDVIERFAAETIPAVREHVAGEGN
jgi:alkanesulfonate monooxygenase SsuD/methylene tetrahydromethanopterin reductase-like flavin-dependent oxidoreductase (luciferase family)